MSAAELNAEAIAEDASASESRGDGTPNAENFDVVADDGTVVMKNNRLTIDDASRQALSQQEIEELKRSSGGKEIIEKILANHSGLEEKTKFARAKYTLRKTKKYMKRFTVLPVDVSTIALYMLEKEALRIMELRDETLGLINCWANAHWNPPSEALPTAKVAAQEGTGRWLVIDETGGLVVASLAEKMGILYSEQQQEAQSPNTEQALPNGQRTSTIDAEDGGVSLTECLTTKADHTHPEQNGDAPEPPKTHIDFPAPASSNTITLVHANVQPNISLLKYFGYDSNNPTPNHPLHTHLNSLSWLQLLYPDEDPTYLEPEEIPTQTLASWKSGKRGMYHKKRRRWERCKNVVDQTRAGDFDGLVIASSMDPATILPFTVPLIRGGGHVVIYSPTAEPLIRICDLYSKDRKAAYLKHLSDGEVPDADDFPVDPRLLLAPTLQTSRVRQWQVLPQRTHPLMTGRGGAEGYVFTGRRVLPLEGAVEARGNYSAKKRKVEGKAEQ